MEWLRFHEGSIKETLEVAESIVTILAIFVGALWAYRLFWLKRQRFPRISIDYKIVHEPLTTNTNLINVTVNLLNEGEVLVRLDSSEIWIQQILPLPSNLSKLIDERRDVLKALRDLITDESREMWQTEIAWPVIAQYALKFRSWNRKEVEPGNSLQLRYDFILESQVELIKIYAFYENAAKRPKRAASSRWKLFFGKKHIVGWDSATVYKIGPIRPIQ